MSEDPVSNSLSDAADLSDRQSDAGSTARRAPYAITADQKTVISKRRPTSSEVPVPASRPSDIGPVLEGEQLGHYFLEEFIGGGGMGAVFRGQDTMLGRTVAVKVVSNESADEETIRRFRNEAQSAARLDHPNIARVYYVGEDKGWNYIVFEYIDGVNIRDLVEYRGVQPLAEAVSFTIQVAEALAHAARRDVIHRDIKPSNILVTKDGRAKLVDMGLARLHQVNSTSDDLTATGVTLGTFDYISPEQARDPRCTDVRSDLYSLGCTLYFLLTGLPPFPDGTVLQKLLSHSSETPPDPREVRPQTDEELAAICLKLMAKQPAHRYQTPSELIADLLVLAQRRGLSGITASRTLTLTLRGGWAVQVANHLPWIVAICLFLLAGVVLQSVWSTAEPVSLEEMRPRFQSATISGPDSAVTLGGGPPERIDRAATGTAEGDSPVSPAETDEMGVHSAPLEPRDSILPGERSPMPNSSEPAGPQGPQRLPDQPAMGAGEPALSTGGTNGAASSTADAFVEHSAGRPPVLVVTDSPEVAAVGEVLVDTLDAAFEELARQLDVDTIELRFHERQVLPLRLDLEPDRELTIRAAEGYEPLIVFRPSAGDLLSQRQMLRLMGGTINFVGVHVAVFMPYEMVQAGWSIFDLNQVDTLTLTRCTLTLQSHFNADAAFFSVRGSELSDVPLDESRLVQVTSPHIELRSCFVRGQANLIRATQGLPFSLDWQQGLFTSTERMIEAGGLPLDSRPEVARIDLSNVTAAMTQGLCRVTVDDRFPNLPTFVIDCQNCVLSHDSSYPLIAYHNINPEDDPQARFVYGGKQNLYESTQVFWSIETNDNVIRKITWDERRQYRDWYDEAIAERQVRWEDPYGSQNRPRVDTQTPQHFLLDRRKDKLAGFDRLQVPVPIEPGDAR